MEGLDSRGPGRGIERKLEKEDFTKMGPPPCAVGFSIRDLY